MDTKEMAQRAHEQTEKLIGKASELTSKAADMGQRAKGTAKDVQAAADLYLHEYAWTTVMVMAFIAGAVGYMLGKRSD